MYGKEAVILCLLSATCQAFWWPANSQPDNDLEDARKMDEPSKQMPYGYFRSLSYLPMMAYPPYYYNQFMPWQNDGSARMSHPYGGMAPPYPTFGAPMRKLLKPSFGQIHSARASAEPFSDFDDDTIDISAPTHSASSLLDPTAATTSPTEPSSTSTTTSTTTTTEENISASTPVNSQLNRLHSNKVLPISDSIAINKDFQSEYSTSSPPMQQPQPAFYSSDSIAKILAERDGQNIQFIPCMCPITLSSMQQLSGTKSKAITATTTTTTTTTATPPNHSSETERTETNPFF